MTIDYNTGMNILQMMDRFPLPDYRRGFAALFAGGVTALAFPDVDLSLLAWVGLVPLLLAVRGVRGPIGFSIGWIAGVGYFGGTLLWVQNTMVEFGGVPMPLAIMVNGLMVITLALYFGAFGLLVTVTAQAFDERLSLSIAPIYFVTLEFIREHAWHIAFPWVRLADSQAWTPLVIQIADITGAAGVSFVIMLVNAAIAALVIWGLPYGTGGPYPGRIVGVAVIGVALTIGYGYERLATITEEEKGAGIMVAALQGNIDQSRKWESSYRREQLSIYISLSAVAAAQGAKVIVWPETAAPYSFGVSQQDDQPILDLARTSDATLIFGAPYYGGADSGDATYNRAWVVTPEGESDHYDKIHLVPFGEYVPLRPLLFFVERMVTAIGDLAPGTTINPFGMKHFSAGVQICYEIIFPTYSRKMVENGAQVIINITNDSWFGRSAASRQSLAAAVFRSVENRAPTIRAAQTGVSAIVTATGEVIGETLLYEKAIVVSEIHPRPLERISLYTRTGDLFSWVCLLVTVGMYVAARRQRGKPIDPGV